MKIKFRHLAAEALEAVGQMRLPGIDTLRALVQPLVALVKAAKAALGRKQAAIEAKVSESERSITVRLTGVVLVLSGSEREFLDSDSVTAEIANCRSESDAMDVLEGMGFRVIGAGRVSGAIDSCLLEDGNNEFSFA
jgi:hypothetical protein